MAEQTAASLPGVTDVNNQLKTDNEQPKNSDTQIAGRIRVTLLFHRNVNETATVIQVENGIVTVKGEAPYLAQKEMIAEYAADIDGVKKIKNEMTVASSYQLKLRPLGVTMDDASVIPSAPNGTACNLPASQVRRRCCLRGGIDGFSLGYGGRVNES